ncbi:hypothetical protein GNX18_16790 [Microbulbifer sp. SH-1]|uniref:hypothetical protein n=1 Tax=Microbulbifer sp. SH-1 TaxID=2681547 RepID=UPI00140CE1CB|nr:hypothetical protein [Microbulbifer sp. SH-1]QIL91255.1 hypothetical protein GNX18_16790 [Microbulbifer sp. SH-1]
MKRQLSPGLTMKIFNGAALASGVALAVNFIPENGSQENIVPALPLEIERGVCWWYPLEGISISALNSWCFYNLMSNGDDYVHSNGQ